jgi:hypothetical protein
MPGLTVYTTVLLNPMGHVIVIELIDDAWSVWMLPRFWVKRFTLSLFECSLVI